MGLLEQKFPTHQHEEPHHRPSWLHRGEVVADGVVYTPLDELFYEAFSHPPGGSDWSYRLHGLTIPILDAISLVCPRADGENAVAYASGTLSRIHELGPIITHPWVTQATWKTDLDPEWRYGVDPLVQQAVSRSIGGHNDSDWKIALGCEDQIVLMKRLRLAIQDSFTRAGFSSWQMAEYGSWQSQGKGDHHYHPIVVHVDLKTLDTGLECIVVTYTRRIGPNTSNRYSVAVHPIPTGQLLAEDYRLGDHHAERMTQLVPLVHYGGGYALAQGVDTLKDRRLHRDRPERIPNPDWQNFGQALIAGLRLIRGNIDAAEDNPNRAMNANINIFDLIEAESLWRCRQELRRHWKLFLAGGQAMPADFRIEEIMREAFVILTKNPIRATLLLCALGILDPFVPGLQTVSKSYDPVVNPVAHDIIDSFHWDSPPLRGEPAGWLAYAGYLPELGFTQFMRWLDGMGYTPWWQTPTPIDAWRGKMPKNPFAAVRLGDMRDVHARWKAYNNEK